MPSANLLVNLIKPLSSMINRKISESSREPIMVSCKVADAWSFLHFTTIFNWRLKKRKLLTTKRFWMVEIKWTPNNRDQDMFCVEKVWRKKILVEKGRNYFCVFTQIAREGIPLKKKTSPLADGEGLWSVAGRLWDKPQVHKLKSRVAYRNGRQVSLVPLVLSCSHPRWWVANEL